MSDDLPPRLPIDPNRFNHYRDAIWVIFVGMIGVWGVINVWHALQEASLGRFYVGLCGVAVAVLMAVVE